MRRPIIVIIQPGLADADDLWVFGELYNLRGLNIGIIFRIVRMRANCRPD